MSVCLSAAEHRSVAAGLPTRGRADRLPGAGSTGRCGQVGEQRDRAPVQFPSNHAQAAPALDEDFQHLIQTLAGLNQDGSLYVLTDGAFC